MPDKDTERSKVSSSCFDNMKEMMRNMISGKDVSCCSCTGEMTRMMPKCCAGPNEPASPTENDAREAAK